MGKKKNKKKINIIDINRDIRWSVSLVSAERTNLIELAVTPERSCPIMGSITLVSDTGSTLSTSSERERVI